MFLLFLLSELKSILQYCYEELYGTNYGFEVIREIKMSETLLCYRSLLEFRFISMNFIKIRNYFCYFRCILFQSGNKEIKRATLY